MSSLVLPLAIPPRRPYLRQRHVSAVLYLNEGGGDDDGALASSPCHGGQGAARKHGREVTATDGAPTLPPTDAHPAATAARAPDFGGGAFCFQHHAPPHQAPEPQARGLQALTAGAGAPGSDAVLRVRPRPGLLVAYTSDDRNVHMVEPVLWGERCTLTLWFSLDPQAQEDAKVGPGSYDGSGSGRFMVDGWQLCRAGTVHRGCQRERHVTFALRLVKGSAVACTVSCTCVMGPV